MEQLIELIKYAGYFGYAGLFLIIFFESFPPTFWLPGDSLLFTTGFLASQGYFNLALLVGTLFLASVAGYIFSYKMGKKLKEVLYDGNHERWFKKSHLEKTEKFYTKYGAKMIIIGRFVPIVRSFGPTLAGAVEMDHVKFLKYTVVGGVFWACGMTSVGFYLGHIIPTAHMYLTPIVLAIIFVSLIPTMIEYVIHLREKRKINNLK